MKKPGKNNPSGIPSEIFRASFQIDPSLSDLDNRQFAGMASVFGSRVDAFQPTIIERGAFTKTLEDRKGRIPILWQHFQEKPIGMPVELIETERGLYIKGKLSKTPSGDEALELMRDGAVQGLSIGFDPIRWDMIKEDENDRDWDATRHIYELRLYEVSVVTFGADPNALISEVRSARFDGPEEEQQKGFTVQTLIFPKDKWDSVDDAKKWAKDHDYRADKVDTTEESWRFRQKEPGDFVRLRTICINPSRKTEMADCKVKAVGGPLKEGMMKTLDEIVEALSFDPKPQEALVGKILSKKNKTRIQDAIKALQALLEAAEPPEKDEQSTALTAEEVEQFKSELWRFELEHPHLPAGGNSNGQTYA